MVRTGLRTRWWCAAALAAAAGCGGENPGPGEVRSLNVVSIIGEVGISPGQFTYPRAIDNDGRSLWVIDKSARVQRIDPKTGASSALWTMPDWAMGKPCGVSVAPGGTLLIPDTHYFRVLEVRPPGGLNQPPLEVSRFGSLGDGPGQFNYCTDVGVLRTADGRGVERLYVGEYGGNDRISVFDAGHQFLFAFGRYGSSADPGTIEFSRPQSMEVDRERGRLVVADSCNHRVGVFELDGTLVRWIGTAGSGPEQLAYPYGVALVGDGTALVTEFGNHRVHHVDYQTGESLGVYGRPGRGPGELTNPWGITILDGVAYVLDSGNDRIQAFRVPSGARRAVASGGGRP